MRRRRGIKRKSRGDHTPEEREYERAREREEEIAHAERERRDDGGGPHLLRRPRAYSTNVKYLMTFRFVDFALGKF